MDLEHRVVLITGPRRIVAEVAKRAAARGADVALSYNQSRNEAEAAAAAIGRWAGGRCFSRPTCRRGRPASGWWTTRCANSGASTCW